MRPSSSSFDIRHSTTSSKLSKKVYFIQRSLQQYYHITVLLLVTVTRPSKIHNQKISEEQIF